MEKILKKGDRSSEVCACLYVVCVHMCVRVCVCERVCVCACVCVYVASSPAIILER